MSAVDTIETLIKLGSLLKDAALTKAGAGNIDWSAFLASPEYKQIKASIEGLLSKLGESDLDDAIRTLQEKQDALLGDKRLAELPTDKLIQFSELGDARLALTARKVKVAADAGFFGWLVSDALPVLIATAERIIPLVL